MATRECNNIKPWKVYFYQLFSWSKFSFNFFCFNFNFKSYEISISSDTDSNIVYMDSCTSAHICMFLICV